MPEATMDEVVGVMLDLREKRRQLKAEYDEADAKLKTRYEKGETYLKQYLLKTGQDSFSAGGATVFTSSQMKPTAEDPQALYDHLRENPDDLPLLQARLQQSVLKDFIEKNDGARPPGVNVVYERKLNLRRKPSNK